MERNKSIIWLDPFKVMETWSSCLLLLKPPQALEKTVRPGRWFKNEYFLSSSEDVSLDPYHSHEKLDVAKCTFETCTRCRVILGLGWVLVVG